MCAKKRKPATCGVTGSYSQLREDFLQRVGAKHRASNWVGFLRPRFFGRYTPTQPPSEENGTKSFEIARAHDQSIRCFGTTYTMPTTETSRELSSPMLNGNATRYRSDTPNFFYDSD